MSNVNYYAQSIMAAYSSMTNIINSNQALWSASGFSITWTPGGMPYGGAFVISFVPRAGGGPNTVTFFTATAEEGSVPLGLLLRSRYWITPVNFQGFTYPGPNVSLVVGELAQARAAALEDICGASIVVGAVQTWTAVGKSQPFYAHSCSLATTEYDCGLEAVQACDIPQWPQSLNQTQESYFPQFPTAGSNIYFPAQTSSDSTPLDMDFAINNGANIFSVVSKTFTEPGD